GGDGTRLLSTERLPASWRQEARAKGAVAQVEGLDSRHEDRHAAAQPPPADASARMNALAWMPDRSLTLQPRGHYLLVIQRLLTLALILAVFGAFLLAAILGQQLARPLLLLAEGVGEVARGDLRPKAIFASGDELGGLTRSFAAMTQQLSDARQLAERSVQEL